ncbi:uncharacterized protein LOC122803143 [Protopterus annectens]|uniref:uncharacterized protein LOC122803143 n=1 Tax=Protopterus annectens TaxID=7888 RepID=UPI001CFADBBE|nr:uncharacterized protein LOC122803143 [Protopterus annectens]
MSANQLFDLLIFELLRILTFEIRAFGSPKCVIDIVISDNMKSTNTDMHILNKTEESLIENRHEQQFFAFIEKASSQWRIKSRLEAPQINCVHENTAVLLQCETSSSEPITYNWNFQPCTTNSDDCELKNNNEMITIRNARSYMSQEVYCTVNNSLHSNHSESFLIRNCITDLRDRLWSSIILLTAANSVSIVSVILLHRFVNLRRFVRLVLPLFAAAAAVPIAIFLVLKLGFVNLTVFLLILAAACLTSLPIFYQCTVTCLSSMKPSQESRIELSSRNRTRNSLHN